ncbi:DnaJ domain-containing protein [Chitinimonas naiadis]
MQQESYYDLLGLRPDATTKQIEAACQQMLRLYQSSGANPHRLAELKDAHAVLTDPSRRASYNGSLKPSKTGAAANGRGAAPAESGKALRWLALLAILALPLVVTAWWINRPARPPKTQAIAVEEVSAPVSAQATEFVYQKTLERDRLMARLAVINQYFAEFARGRKKVEEGEGYSFLESDKREAELLKPEREWILARLDAIAHTEMEQARRGIKMPEQFYAAPQS